MVGMLSQSERSSFVAGRQSRYRRVVGGGRRLRVLSCPAGGMRGRCSAEGVCVRDVAEWKTRSSSMSFHRASPQDERKQPVNRPHSVQCSLQGRLTGLRLPVSLWLSAEVGRVQPTLPAASSGGGGGKQQLTET